MRSPLAKAKQYEHVNVQRGGFQGSQARAIVCLKYYPTVPLGWECKKHLASLSCMPTFHLLPKGFYLQDCEARPASAGEVTHRLWCFQLGMINLILDARETCKIRATGLSYDILVTWYRHKWISRAFKRLR